MWTTLPPPVHSASGRVEICTTTSGLDPALTDGGCGRVPLKSNERIDAFAFLGYVALLLHALIERDLRNAMRKQGIAELALYPEDRACTAPTAARVIEVLEPLCAHRLTAGDEVLKRYDPSLSPLHQQILDLLGVPTTAYLTSRTTGI